MLFTAIASFAAFSVVQGVAIAPRAAPSGVAAASFSYPPSRAWVDGETGNGPCGGNNTPNPVPFPMSIGDVAQSFVRDVNHLQVNYAPTAQANDQANFKPLLPMVLFTYPGTSCSNAPNWATLGFAAGDNVTLQSVSYTGPNNSTVYSCADVTLAAYHAYSTSKPEYTCENVVSRTTTRGGQTNEEGLALGVSGASRDGSDGLAPAAAGGIGAGVTLAVVALLALAAFFLGGVRLFRNGNKATDAGHPVMHQHSRDDASSVTNSMQKA